MKRRSHCAIAAAAGCLLLLVFPAAGASGGKSAGGIVFVRDHLCQKWQDCGLGEVAVVDADGSGLRVLTHDKITEVSPRWSPDGQEIAYIRPDDDNVQVWLMAADGTHQRPLTHLRKGQLWGSTVMSSLDWSPDGRQIVFAAFRPGKAGTTQLYLADARTGAAKLLLRTYLGVASGVDGPVWSPDGRWIAFTSLTRHGPYQIDLFSTRTRHVHRLRQGMDPAWSPDSRRIAFNGDRGMIHVMNADGTHPRSLDRYGANPSWSADGRWIVFQSTAENENLAEVRPDGTGFHLISHLTTKWLELEPDW
jgi:TolB protein